jgi:hypothetical protein
MPAEPADFDPQKLWQSQPTEHEVMTVADIRRKAQIFQAKIRRRNIIECVAAAFVIAMFLPVLLYRGSWMMQAGAAMAIVAVIFVVWQLHRRASAHAVPETSEALTAFHRTELIRQRDALRSVGVWYIAPCLPSMVMIMLGRWFQAHALHRSIEQDHLFILGGSAVAVVIVLAVWLLNRRAATRIQGQIDSL